MRGEWRSVWGDSGGLCVTVGGTKQQHWWCAGRVDSWKWVRVPSSLHNNLDPVLHLWFDCC